mmetsp:Transcript_2874/g.6695  ORF Transcript_2874/g.6695 Transcript_2874/m.6695 type:complete len:187 (+) Transcript_2874:300-860(+)
MSNSESKSDAVSTVDQAFFDDKAKGGNVVIEKQGTLIKGSGPCIANAALHQDQCYFEVKIVRFEGEDAKFAIGVAHRKPEVVQGELGDSTNSWAFKSSTSTETFTEGDILGCSFDQSSGRPVLTIRKNDHLLPPGSEVRGFRGVVYPAVEVSPGCELEVNFSIDNDGFVYKPPSGFSGIIPSRSLV